MGRGWGGGKGRAGPEGRDVRQRADAPANQALHLLCMQAGLGLHGNTHARVLGTARGQEELGMAGHRSDGMPEAGVAAALPERTPFRGTGSQTLSGRAGGLAPQPSAVLALASSSLPFHTLVSPLYSYRRSLRYRTGLRSTACCRTRQYAPLAGFLPRGAAHGDHS